jgi:riboflavin biosynthesis pyrimidine reductase
MLTLLRSLRSRPVYLSEPASFIAALIIAELFYKFHSFLLETGAFLLTWLALATLVDGVVRWIGPKPSASLR